MSKKFSRKRSSKPAYHKTSNPARPLPAQTLKHPPFEGKGSTVTGVLRLHPRGFGFVQPEGAPQAIFIPRHLIAGAVDGDLVEIEVATTVSAKGPEGRITSILRRGRSHMAGTVIELLSHGEAMIHVPMLGGGSPLRLLPTSEKITLGDRIIVQIQKWGNEREETVGILDRVIGSIYDPTKDIETIIEAYEFEQGFTSEVLAEATAYGTKVRPADLKNREDLRALECFTIDPETAKDFDDAISLTMTPEGHYELGVHIADVAHYVKAGSQLDIEAQKRCNSVYLPGTVLPMLPQALSNELCSLKPNVVRLAASVIMIFDERGNLQSHRITRSAIRSQQRFTYGQAREILAGREKSKHATTLFLMADLCMRLKEKRVERGSLQFSMPQIKIKIEDDGSVTGIEVEEYDLSHQLVEEFMLKANEVVATHLSNLKQPLTYRVHASPSSEDLQEFAALASAFGYSLSDDLPFSQLQELFDKARESVLGQFLATAFIRTMKLAMYSIDNIGHYGLGLEYYTHFTSPIRRYIDLIVHRALFGELPKEIDLTAIAKRCSERERHAAKAEGEALLLKKLRYLIMEKQREPSYLYEAIVAEVKPMGIVFAIPHLLMEGFLPLSELGTDYYHYNQAANQLVGKHQAHTYKVGMQLKVQPREINLITLQVRWRMIEEGESRRHFKGKSGKVKKHTSDHKSRSGPHRAQQSRKTKRGPS